jgi:ubiquinone/menaquinone biosynthesis C-methylase UbiE
MKGHSPFDAKAATWDADSVKTARTLAIAEAIRRRVSLSSSMRALEYGCGTGSLSFALRPDLGHVTLADNSPGMLAVLEEKIAAAGATCMLPVNLDLSSDPIPSTRFDLVYTAMTFHHIEDIAAILRNLFALLAPRGTLCVADLDAEDGSFHGPEAPTSTEDSTVRCWPDKRATRDSTKSNSQTRALVWREPFSDWGRRPSRCMTNWSKRYAGPALSIRMRRAGEPGDGRVGCGH